MLLRNSSIFNVHFLPEYMMLFFIFLLLLYCIFFAFSNMESVQKMERARFANSNAIQIVGINSCRISGEWAGRNIYALSMLIIVCTIILLLSCQPEWQPDSRNFFFSDVATSRFEYNNLVELFVLCISLVLLSVTYSYNKAIGILSFEYYIILLFCLCSFCFFLHATNLIFIYVLIELQSISSYILTSINKRNRYSVEAGLKYFILGSFTSILLVFGFSLLYGFSGIFTLNGLATYVSYLYTNADEEVSSVLFYWLLLAFLFIFIGFLFKIYASPFHFWVADIYQGSPTSVTVFLSTIPVVSYMYVFIKFYMAIFSEFFFLNYNILYFLSIVSLFSGVAGALVQKKIKKLIAYSSISTIGYILAGLSCDNILLVQGSLLLLFVYVLTILPIFIILLNYRMNSVRTMDSISSFASLCLQNKCMFFMFCSFFFSLAGVPPFAGFFSKFYLFTTLGTGSFYLLLSVCVFAALLSCYYYIKVVKMVYYDKSSSLSYFISDMSYGQVFICVVFFVFNCTFLFFFDYVADVCLYISICLF